MKSHAFVPAVEQAGELGTRRAKEPGERDARKEGRARRADVRVRRLQPVLGGDDVGPLLEQVRRQPDGHLVHEGRVVEVRAVRQTRRRRADEQRERMRLRRALLLELRAERLRLREQRLHQRHVQAVGGADLETAVEDAQRLLASADGVARDHDALVELAQGEIAVRDLRDDRHGDGAPGGVGGEEFLERGVLEVAHAAPEVELPPDDAHADVPDRRRWSAPRRGELLRESAPGSRRRSRRGSGTGRRGGSGTPRAPRARAGPPRAGRGCGRAPARSSPAAAGRRSSRATRPRQRGVHRASRPAGSAHRPGTRWSPATRAAGSPARGSIPRSARLGRLRRRGQGFVRSWWSPVGASVAGPPPARPRSRRAARGRMRTRAGGRSRGSRDGRRAHRAAHRRAPSATYVRRVGYLDSALRVMLALLPVPRDRRQAARRWRSVPPRAGL